MTGNSSTRGDAAGFGAGVTAAAATRTALPFWRDPAAVDALVAAEVGAGTAERGGAATGVAALPFAPTVVHAPPVELCALGTT